MPLPISDDLLAVIERAALPVSARERPLFLEGVAAELARHSEIGPGLVHRACAQVQRQYSVEARNTAGSCRELRHLERERQRLIREP
jgi:hypothetical protein